MSIWTTKPTIIIKKLSNGKYTWLLYLSNNRKKPTCVAPSQYNEAFKARDRARQFAAKFKSQIVLKDIEAKTTETIDSSVLIIDETRLEDSTEDEIDFT